MPLCSRNIQQSIKSAIQLARQPQHRRKEAWVAFCHSIIALSIGVLFWMSCDFKFHDNSDIVGWVSVHQYPKQQETIAYVGAFGCVILGVVGGWFAWCVLAWSYSHRHCCTLSLSLRRTAWGFSGYLISLIPLIRGQWTLSRLLLIPLGSVLLTGVILWFWRCPRSDLPKKGTAATTDYNCLPEPFRPHKWKIPIYYIFVPLLLYLYLFNGQSIHHPIDLFHEGERLAPLNALLRGGIPFRDIYIQHGLFQNAGKAWLATLWGEPSLASLRMTENFIAPLGYIAIYFLALQVFRFWGTAIVLALITSSQNFWVSDRHALGLLSVAVIAYALRRGHFDRTTDHSSSWWRVAFTNGWAISAGILTTLAFFYSTEVGLYTFAACGIFFVLRGAFPRFLDGIRPLLFSFFPLLSYLTGVLIGLMPFLVYFGWHGAIDDLIGNSIIQCVYQIPTWGLPYPSILPALQQIVSFTTFKGFLLSETFRWYLPVFVYLITAGILVFRSLHPRFWHNTLNAVMLLVLLKGIMLFRTALGRSDGGHLTYGSTLFWIFMLIALESGITHCIRRIRALENLGWILWTTALALFVFGWYVNSVHHPLKVTQNRVKAIIRGQTLPKAYPVTWTRLGGLQIDQAQISHLRRVVDAIQQRTQPDEPIFDFSSQGAYYFFADRPSATRYHQSSYASTPAMQREVIRDLERTHTRLVIFRTGGWFDNIDGILATKRHFLIARYLDEHYSRAADIDGTIILLRERSSCPQTRSEKD